MIFNTFRNRVLLAFFFALPSYSFLYLIRGYDFRDLKLYAHSEYSTMVFVILIILFEFHTFKSRKLEKSFPWKYLIAERLGLEIITTICFTTILVSGIVYFFYDLIWEMNVWGPALIEYNLFALLFSFLIGFFVNAEIVLTKWKESIIEREILEKENIRARLGALQAQISPHFLFNNLNVLGALIDEDSKAAKEYLDSFGSIYRYILSNKNRDVVSLNEEIAFIQTYLSLLEIRFGANVSWEIPQTEFKTAKIPPVTLQILIENAIKHNEVSTRNPLHILIEQKDDEYLVVENNKSSKFNTSIESTEVGLENIFERYKFFTDLPVKIFSNAEKFEVQIPILKLSEYENPDL